MLPVVCVECSSVGHCTRGIHRPAHAPGPVKDGPVPEHLDHWQAYVHTHACAHTHTFKNTLSLHQKLAPGMQHLKGLRHVAGAEE